MHPSAPGLRGGPKRRFGVFEFDPRVPELRKHGIRVKLQQQPLEVLDALLESPGDLVSREVLRSRLWAEDTFVDFEQSLNKAVNKLRDALGDSADHPLYVETVPRRGYRFVAPVEVERPAAPALGIPVVPKRVLRSWMVAGIGVFALALTTGLWPTTQPRTQITQLTTDGFWKYPVLFVNGGKILYTASRSNLIGFGDGELWSVPNSGGRPQRQDSPCDAGTPYISGFSYVQKRILVACWDGVENHLWLTGFGGENPKPIGRYPANTFLSISPDLETLLLTRQEGMFLRSLDGGEERRLAPFKWKGPALAFFPFWHPSGQRIGFPRFSGGVVKLREVRTDGNGSRPLVPEFAGEQTSGRWSPDGERLYFVSRREIYLQNPRRWLGWMRKPSPVRLTTGSVQFYPPYEDPDNLRIVYAWGEVRGGELMKLNRGTGVFEPYLDGLPADCLDYSPDGKWIAYVDFPRGKLWKCKRDGSGRVLLDDSLFAYYMPRWSPDGTRIAFAATETGHPFRIYTIPARGGDPTPVRGAPGPGFDPSWSPDGKRLAFAPLRAEAERPEEDHVSIVNVDTGEITAVAGSERFFSVRWSPDGGRLAAISYNLELFVYSFAGNRWEKLGSGPFGFPRWSKDSRYLYGIISAKAPTLRRIEVATRSVENIHAITEFSTAGVLHAGASWTPNDEPVVLKDTSTYQIYRIERGR